MLGHSVFQQQLAYCFQCHSSFSAFLFQPPPSTMPEIMVSLKMGSQVRGVPTILYRFLTKFTADLGSLPFIWFNVLSTLAGKPKCFHTSLVDPSSGSSCVASRSSIVSEVLFPTFPRSLAPELPVAHVVAILILLIRTRKT